MSEFTCPVVEVPWLKPVPNSDALEFTQVYETNVVVRKGQLKVGDLAVYIPLESMVPMTKPQFQGLGIKTDKELYRVKAVRLRGTYSEGLLVPITDVFAAKGQDRAQDWGITKYVEPEIPESIMGTKKAPQDKEFPAPKYNVEPLLKNRDRIPEGMGVIVTEKLHGCNGRFVYAEDAKGEKRLIVGSHNVWKKPLYSEAPWKRKLKVLANKLGCWFKLEEPQNDDVWWEVAKKLDLAEKLKKWENYVFYGEVYGSVQDLKYSVPGEEKVRFRVFDMYDSRTKEWLCFDTVRAVCSGMGIETVPVLYRGLYDKEKVDPLRTGKSVLDGVTMREGFVIRPIIPTDKYDKQAYKYVSEEYKLRKSGTEHQ